MFGLVLQVIAGAVIFWLGWVFLQKKKLKAKLRREEIRRLVRLAKAEEEAIAESQEGNYCHQDETGEEDEARIEKQPSMPEATMNNFFHFISLILEDFLGSASDDDTEEENKNRDPLISQDVDTKKALEQSEERVKLLKEELAKYMKEVSVLRSECRNWSDRTSFLSRRLSSFMRESDENQTKQEEFIQPLKNECVNLRRELEQERRQRLQIAQDERLKIAKIKAERLRQELANACRSVEYAENGWKKALRELEGEKELVREIKMECEEIRQSCLRQMEKKEQDLANALNAAAAAEAKLSNLEREVSSLDDKACAICLTNEKDVAFGCGHMTCGDCMMTISNCHICREPITSRLRLFPG